MRRFVARRPGQVDHAMSVLADELDKLRVKVSHPEVVSALQRAHSMPQARQEEAP
jgi:hypothetical protein